MAPSYDGRKLSRVHSPRQMHLNLSIFHTIHNYNRINLKFDLHIELTGTQSVYLTDWNRIENKHKIKAKVKFLFCMIYLVANKLWRSSNR